MYSRVNNGEINQRYGPTATATPRSTMSMDKFPPRSLDSDASITGSPLALSNYATLRGTKLNGFSLNVSFSSPF